MVRNESETAKNFERKEWKQEARTLLEAVEGSQGWPLDIFLIIVDNPASTQISWLWMAPAAACGPELRVLLPTTQCTCSQSSVGINASLALVIETSSVPWDFVLNGCLGCNSLPHLVPPPKLFCVYLSHFLSPCPTLLRGGPMSGVPGQPQCESLWATNFGERES